MSVKRIRLEGKIDSGNAARIEESIMAQLSGEADESVVLDASSLEYISSAGLRMLLRLRKAVPELSIAEVDSSVYEILDMTGFTQMMTVEKAFREVSIEGCEEIGRGANGVVYRIDRENVVKVYHDPDALEDIKHEREVARLALVLGVPTAISYDVVRVGKSYGSVFELLNARSFSDIISEEPEKLDWCVDEYVAMLKRIHGTVVPEGKLPDYRERAVDWAERLRGHLPEEAWERLVSLMRAIPYDDHMIHGDLHTGNLEFQQDEVLLIDMDTLSVGHPVFELASIFNAYVGFYECDPGGIKDFQGFDIETGHAFWEKALKKYLGTGCAAKLREVEDKARVIGYTHLVRRAIRKGGLENEKSREEIEHWTAELIELLGRVDKLIFLPDELELEAEAANLPEVQGFLEERLERIDCTPKEAMQIGVAAEEIFINIASYAYEKEPYSRERKRASMLVETAEEPKSVTITFADAGEPYDPLGREDPDVTLAAESRTVGGLGIYLAKKLMDDVSYAFTNGRNVLTLKKIL